MFKEHADQAGAARAAVEPEDDWIIIRVSLGVEEDVVEGSCGEVEVS